MEPFEIQTILETFSVICDTREQTTARSKKRLQQIGVPVERATLAFGDYCGNVRIDGEPLFNTGLTVRPACVIERKMSLEELSSNFTRGRKRFEREFERARSAGAKVYLLVENGSWEAIRNHRYRTKYRPEAFMASLTAWMVRYDMTPVFCKADSSGELIREILYRDMKERLGRGEHG